MITTLHDYINTKVFNGLTPSLVGGRWKCRSGKCRSDNGWKAI